jgi:uncharacterized protein
MTVVFADTFYWIALLSPRDQWYGRVLAYSELHPGLNIVTTEGVLDELLNYFSKRGIFLRQKAAELYVGIAQSPNLQVLSYTPKLRRAGFNLYQQRPDKGYSMTDCISMSAMQNLNIREVLTNDKHFAQEGFTILFTN